MIQRIQSVLLFFVAVVMVLTLFFPIWEKTEPQTGLKIIVNSFKAYETTNPGDAVYASSYIAAIAIVAAVTALISIFKYKNRLFQMKLGLVNSLLMSALIGANVYAIHEVKKIGFTLYEESFDIAFFLPIAGIILNMLANRFIRKDEELVRSVDRLR
ncbi:MAG: DUF4293 domain-containing protein [Sporocytophaga sp.]|nr:MULTISPECIES: DUF4293 domain-containing protein [Sporocytophaga]MBO9700150.1 DUF4293 domain-containing protein [Sporocytophaga sp.]